MKKTLLALAVMAASSSVSAVEIYKAEDGSVNFYGQMRTEMKFQDEQDHDARLGSGSSRAGINAAYSIDNDLSVVGNVEFGLGYDKGGKTVKDTDGKDVTVKDEVNVRYHYYGFKSQELGQITFGKHGTVSDDVWGADYSYFFGGSGILSTVGTHDASMRYTLEKDAFWVKGIVGLSEDNANSELYELYAGTNLAGVDVHTGVGLIKENIGAAEAKITAFEVTGEYSMGDILLGSTYYFRLIEDENSSFDIKQNAISVAASYEFMPKTAAYGGYEYVNSKAKSMSSEHSNVVYVGVEHKFASWARVYAEYGYGDGYTLGYTSDKNDITVDPGQYSDSSNFGLGMRLYW